MRTRHSPSEGHARRQGAGAARPIVSAIAEPSAGRDEHLGLMFRNMRLAMRVPRETIARRVATTTAIIDNFEAGAVTALPHWKETTRIVRSYCELLRLDPEPLLWRIGSHLQAVASPPPQEVPAPRQLDPTTAPPPPVGAWAGPRSQAPRTETGRGRPQRRRRRARALFALSAPIALLAGIVYLAQTVPKPVYWAISLLPDAAERPVRAGLDYLVVLTSPSRDGLKWIEVGDPRSRKADKLQTSAR